MVDLTDPSIKIHIGEGGKDAPCCLCKIERGSKSLSLRKGELSKRVASICPLCAKRLIATRQSKRATKRFGNPVGNSFQGMGGALTGAQALRLGEGLSPSFVSAGTALFHLTAKQLRRRNVNSPIQSVPTKKGRK